MLKPSFLLTSLQDTPRNPHIVTYNLYGTKLDAPLNHKFGGHGTSDYYGAQAFLDYLEFGKEPYTTVDRAVELTLPGILAHEAAMKEHVWPDVPHI